MAIILKTLTVLMVMLVPMSAWGVCGGSYSGSSPGTITAYDASQECVAAAVAAADNGDTVSIPAGDKSWTIPVQTTKAINIVGAGTSSTIIREALDPAPSGSNYIGLIEFTPETTARNGLSTLNGVYTISVSNIAFVGQEPRTSYAMGIQITNNSATPIRRVKIYNNTFTHIHRAVQTNGEVHGVFYSNTLVDSSGAYPLGYNRTSWDSNTVTPGSGLGWYIEDNTFTFSVGVGLVDGGGHGMSHVIRYNSVSGSGDGYFEAHGNQTGSLYSTQMTEAYGNDFDMDCDGPELVHRGGRGFIYFNRMKTGIALHVNEEYSDAESVTPVNNACVEAGPQVCAEDCVCQKVNHTYYFNNRKISNATLLSFHIGDYNQGTELAENREFWNHNASYNGTTQIGVYCGTSLPANCTTGDGAWITTQACDSVPSGSYGTNPTTKITGALYRCESTDTWSSTPYYTPYTYPHPLRGSGGGGETGSGPVWTLGTGAVATFQ
jgi:hypothetical protein